MIDKMTAATVPVIVAVVLLQVVVVLCNFPSTLTLERAIPHSHEVELSQLVARDRLRHGRLLQSANGVVDFSVAGTFDPFVVGLVWLFNKLLVYLLPDGFVSVV